MTPAAKLARMAQPNSLRTDAFQPWSRGRGVDVWAMLCASITGDLAAIQTLVERDSGLVNCECEYLTPLHFAVRENHQAVVEFLIENGASLVRDIGESLPAIARVRGHNELAVWLDGLYRECFGIEPAGSSVAAMIRSRDQRLLRTTIEGHPELVHAADERGNRPIHWAVMTRQMGLIDFLLERGSDIKARRPDGARPLDLTNGDYHYRGWRDVSGSAVRKHEVLIGYLLARGADYDISVAAKIGDLDRVRECLKDDPGLANRVPAYSTYYSGLPLRCASGAGHLEVVKFLLDHGANPNEPEPGIAPEGGALHAAIGGKHLEIVKLLLERGANPNAAVESSGNCLSMAKHVGASREMQDLIASHGGVRTVELLCYHGDVEVLGAVLNANPRTMIDDACLHAATSEGQLPILELILRHQPEILKSFALRRAKTPALARWLMERGLDPNRRDWLGTTPLHRCAAAGDKATAAVCLEFGADINAIDTEFSSTPLAWAARANQAEMAHWLLTQGADASVPKDVPWALPTAWATRHQHAAVLDALS